MLNDVIVGFFKSNSVPVVATLNLSPIILINKNILDASRQKRLGLACFIIILLRFVFENVSLKQSHSLLSKSEIYTYNHTISHNFFWDDSVLVACQ